MPCGAVGPDVCPARSLTVPYVPGVILTGVILVDDVVGVIDGAEFCSGSVPGTFAGMSYV